MDQLFHGKNYYSLVNGNRKVLFCDYKFLELINVRVCVPFVYLKRFKKNKLFFEESEKRYISGGHNIANQAQKEHSSEIFI